MAYPRHLNAIAAKLSVMLVGASASLVAQSAEVHGVITDSVTSQSLTGVLLHIVQIGNTSDTLVASTDEEGRFRLASLFAGTYWLLVSQVGYEQRELEFDIVDGETFELPRHALWLEPIAPTELPGVQVTAEHIPALMRPFYARRETGFGHFLTREEVEAKNPRKTYDVLRGIPGIMVRSNPGYGVDADSRRYFVESLRMATIRACPMLVFFNGIKIGPSNEVDLEALISPNNVGAVEVYASVAGMPVQFNVPGAACGVIVFWSRMR